MHSFVRYRDLLAFELVGVADPPAKGLIGRDGARQSAAPLLVSVFHQISPMPSRGRYSHRWLCRRVVADRSRDILREAVQLAIGRGISVFSFVPLPADDDLRALASRQGVRIESPTMSLKSIAEIPGDVPGRVGVLVVGVFGTSSQQGKSTLQLALRRRLLELGYQVGQIGTEYQSELFGIDFGFSIGYDSPIDLAIQDHAPFLQAKTRQIAATGPDIIIVGAQRNSPPTPYPRSPSL